VRPALAAALAPLLLLGVAGGARGEIPDALVVLEVAEAARGGVASAAPPRFVLFEDGRVFVGGSDRVMAGRLEKGERDALRKSAEQVRRLKLPASVSLGDEPAPRARLRLAGRPPLDLLVIGRTQDAPGNLQPLARLLEELARFHHPSLRPWTPERYLLAAREGALVGGCRTWTFAMPLAEALVRPAIVSATEARGWPQGSRPASVCEGQRRYVVTLRPLLPGEVPLQSP
jgi:hypothetical protein